MKRFAKTITATTLLCIFVLLLSAVVLNGCSKKKSTEGPEKVTIRLKWLHQAQFDGFYYAKEGGLYKERGLDVTLHPGGIGVDGRYGDGGAFRRGAAADHRDERVHCDLLRRALADVAPRVCPRNRTCGLPLAKLHLMRVPPPDVDTIDSPSGLNARSSTK